MKFKETFLEELKSTPPSALADICGLKYKAGQNGGVDAFSYTSEEKTPSLKINSVNGVTLFKDFSSGGGGNAITLFSEVHNMGFVDAVKDMANRLGVPVEYEEDGKPSSEQQQSKAKLYLAMDWASETYAKNLDGVLDYLNSRGITEEQATKWGLGFAKDDWQLLANILDDKQKVVASQAGLISQSKKNSKYYDFFHDRLIFPIVMGNQTIALAGRTMIDQKPKYLNTQNSPIYNKSKALFGFDNASKIGGSTCYIMEGYMDVIATDSISLPAVATCGTAITVEHLTKLYTRFDELCFCFDGDSAGIKAKEKAIELVLPFIQNGKAASFITIPDGKDPADCILENNIAIFEDKQSLSEAMCEGTDSLSEAEQMKFLSEFTEKMNKLDDSLQRILLIHRVANKLDVDEKAIKSFLG